MGWVGVFHAKGWWSKTSCPPSKVCLPWVWKGGTWDVPGILAGCPGLLGVFKKFVQKKFVRIFRSLILGVVDAQGVFWMQHLDGLLYRVKDWNGNGKIEEGTDEVCTIDVLAGSTTGGITIVPGMLLVSTCDALYVFKDTA